MYTQGLITTLIFAVFMLLWILELLRRKKINEVLALWWLIIILLIIILIICPPLLQLIMIFIGTSLPITAIFLLCLLFLFAMLVYFSMKISILSKNVITLTQHIAIIEKNLCDLERKSTQK